MKYLLKIAGVLFILLIAGTLHAASITELINTGMKNFSVKIQSHLLLAVISFPLLRLLDHGLLVLPTTFSSVPNFITISVPVSFQGILKDNEYE